MFLFCIKFHDNLEFMFNVMYIFHGRIVFDQHCNYKEHYLIFLPLIKKKFQFILWKTALRIKWKEVLQNDDSTN